MTTYKPYYIPPSFLEALQKIVDRLPAGCFGPIAMALTEVRYGTPIDRCHFLDKWNPVSYQIDPDVYLP